MILEETKKAYSQILKTMKKHKDICDFDIEDFERKSKIHLFGLELKEVHGLNINPKSIYNTDWINCGEHKKIAWFDNTGRRNISWSDDGRQPKNEYVFILKFPTGPYIFGDGNLFDKDYPVDFFHKFWMELLTYKPDYSDSHNSSLYWKIENAKDIFNSFDEILKKYYELNNEDIKQRRIAKMEAELAKLKG